MASSHNLDRLEIRFDAKGLIGAAVLLEVLTLVLLNYLHLPLSPILHLLKITSSVHLIP